MVKLKAIRLSQGISVPKFSEMTGVHRRTIEDIEKRGDCMLSTAYTFAKALGITLNDLYSDETAEE